MHYSRSLLSLLNFESAATLLHCSVDGMTLENLLPSFPFFVCHHHTPTLLDSSSRERFDWQRQKPNVLIIEQLRLSVMCMNLARLWWSCGLPAGLSVIIRIGIDGARWQRYCLSSAVLSVIIELHCWKLWW